MIPYSNSYEFFTNGAFRKTIFYSMLRYLGTIIIVIICALTLLKVHQLNGHLKALDSITRSEHIDRLRISKQVETKLSGFFSKNIETNPNNTSFSQLFIIMIVYTVIHNDIQIVDFDSNNLKMEIIAEERPNFILLHYNKQYDTYTVKYISTTLLFDSLMTQKLSTIER